MNPPPSSIHSSLPDDIALKIASSLEVEGVCSLGSCSRFWRQLCGSDCVWEPLCRHRWPALALDPSDLHHNSNSNSQGWRDFYIKSHMAEKVVLLLKLPLKPCLGFKYVEVVNYLNAINTMEFGFGDVQLFFLKPKLNVLLNMVGLHYCITSLRIPDKDLMEVLHSCKIADRQVRVQWWNFVRRSEGMSEEMHSRNISLRDLVTCKDEVQEVLHGGPSRLRTRIQFSPAKSEPLND